MADPVFVLAAAQPADELAGLHPHLHEVIRDDDVIASIAAAAESAEATARNEGADAFSLPREVGERAYHLLGKALSSLWITELGFELIPVRGDQFRWRSPEGRYSERLNIVHCRGHRQHDGTISVWKKGPESRALIDGNAALIDPQPPLDTSLGRVLVAQDDPLRTIWIITDTDKHGLSIRLAIPVELSPSGKTMLRVCDTYLVGYLAFGEGGEGEIGIAPTPETPPTEFVVSIEDK